MWRKCKVALEDFGLPISEIRRGCLILGSPILIIWLGFDAIVHIGDLYDGLCEMQGPGMADLLLNDDPQGNCTGISDYLQTLGLIMGAAAIAVPSALAGWWYYYDRQNGRKH